MKENIIHQMCTKLERLEIDELKVLNYFLLWIFKYIFIKIIETLTLSKLNCFYTFFQFELECSKIFDKFTFMDSEFQHLTLVLLVWKSLQE